ncbi:MAG: universal stress protein [Nitrospiraceae bacterium]|nr:MAG: universal stress protein [Nitrospiraceae bacterium]
MSAQQSCPITGLKAILLATDGSAYSEAALTESIHLSKACASKLYVVSVIEMNPEYEAMAPQIVEKAATETKQILDYTKECIEKEGIACEVIAHTGEEPADFIVEEAKKHGVNMIVMGMHGRRGLKRLMMGSVTAKVLAHTPCSVLIVKPKL